MWKFIVAAIAAFFIAVPAVAQGFAAQNFLTSQVSCSTSATQASPARYRNAITIKVPTGGATVFIGPAGVTPTTGFSVDAGTAMTLQPYAGAVYCVVATGTQTISIGETF